MTEADKIRRLAEIREKAEEERIDKGIEKDDYPSFYIGDRVVDEDGYNGIVGIKYDDGDFVTLPGGNCSAHPNPQIVATANGRSENMNDDYSEIARRDFEREIYRQCDKEDPEDICSHCDKSIPCEECPFGPLPEEM